MRAQQPEPIDAAANALRQLAQARYLNLETYRKNGAAVRTPVWFAARPENPKLYVYTTADSGKAKRIRHSGTAKIAACDMRGNVTGPWIDAEAKLVTGEEFATGMRLLNQRYFPWKQLLNLSAKLFSRHSHTVLSITPQNR